MSVELKLKLLCAAEIAEAVGGKLMTYFGASEKAEQSAISTNSADGGCGVIFCAIKGQRVDGHDYIADAIKLGSTCFICERVPDSAEEVAKPFCAIVVEDTIRAIGDLAAYYRGFSKAKFVGITGSRCRQVYMQGAGAIPIVCDVFYVNYYCLPCSIETK